MNLTRYRVQSFKSVNDSRWIDCEDVTTLVGINEAGKSNLLLALWKLNPVLVDSDKSGQDAKKKLLSGLYQSDKDSIFEIKDFTSIDGSEVEDLIPYTYLKNGINKLFVNIDFDEDQFVDIYDKALPILPQIESFASEHSIDLPQGWKVGRISSIK